MILALGTVAIFHVQHVIMCVFKMDFAHTDQCECIHVFAACMDCQKLPYSAGRHVVLS